MEVHSHEADHPSIKSLITVNYHENLETDSTHPIKLTIVFGWSTCRVIIFKFRTCNFLTQTSTMSSPAVHVADQMLTVLKQHLPGFVNLSRYKPYFVGVLDLARKNKDGKIITIFIHDDYNAFFKGLEKVKYDESHSQQCHNQKTCTLCLDDFVDGVKITKLACLHMFHRKCLRRWLKENKSCPFCGSLVICKTEVEITV